MSIRTRIYAIVVVAMGLAALIVEGILPLNPRSWVGFGVYLCLSVLASGFKVRLPGVTGTVSAGFFPILIGLVSLTVPEAMIAACAAVLIQCVWRSSSRQPLKVAFNTSSAAITVAVAALVYQSPWLRVVDFEFAVRLTLLAVVYFAANTLPVAGIIALTEGKSVLSVWRGLFWSMPYYLVGSAAAGLVDLTRSHLGWQTALLAIPIAYHFYRSSTVYIGRAHDAKVHAEETAALYLRTITSLALAIEAKDQETHDHLQRVQVYAVEIGKQLGLGEEELEALRAAALLHDIGKIAVPDYILSKPGKLTPQEFQKMKVHPVVGAEILERVRFPFPVAPIVRCHHEKWDGTGYPAGLKGEEIPIGSRILTAVDCLDALASDRQYRRALPLDEAMAAVERDSGKAFDPRVVAVLKARYRELEQMAKSNPLAPWRLSTDVHIENGAAPGAGFAEAVEASRPAQAEVSDMVRLRCLLEAVTSGERFLSSAETMSILASRLRHMVPFDALAVYRPQGGILRTMYTTDSAALGTAAIPMGSGVSGWAAEANRGILNGNPGTELARASSAVAMPLPGRFGSAGVMTLYAVRENAFRAEDLELLAGIAGDVGRYLEKALEEERGENFGPILMRAAQAARAFVN